MNTETETWRPVVGYEGAYEVSDQGRVRSVDRVVGDGRRARRRKGASRTVTRDRRGYLYVRVCKKGAPANLAVHVAVLEAFVEPRPDGLVTRHLNGNPSDNRVANLAWGTQQENIHDQFAHGTHVSASKTHCKQGHEFTSENTDVRGTPTGTARVCRTCRREVKRVWGLKRDRRKVKEAA